MMTRVGLGLGLFFGSMALGWVLQQRGVLNEARASRLVRLVVMGLSPAVLCLIFWRMDLRSFEPWRLPFLGFLVSASTQLPASWYARWAKLSRTETGSFLTCAFFSNLGYLGAFTAFALFGEAGYALCALYFVFFSPSFYTIGFSLAASHGHRREVSAMSSAYNDQLRLFPFLGMLAGALLSLSRIPRPPVFGALNHVLIPLDTALYLIAIGSQVTLTPPGRWLSACVAMCVIKFLYSPLVALGLISLFNLHGLSKTIVLIEAATPVGVSPLVLPLLFGVDRKLANAVWLFTTLAAIPVFALFVPWLVSP